MNRSLLRIYSQKKLFQSLILNDVKYLNTTRILNSTFPKDVQPGPYPVTEEQRIAAAKKYGMSISEYKPYTETESVGDYPDIPIVTPDMKDPFDEWDDPILRRDFGDPLKLFEEYYTQDRATNISYYGFTHTKMLAWLLMFVGTFYFLFYATSNLSCSLPMTARQLPRNKELYKEKHYTFETSSNHHH